jgi:hypothetical protein
LTGDVGRDCGDASRALLLFQAFQSVDQRHAFGVFTEGTRFRHHPNGRPVA